MNGETLDLYRVEMPVCVCVCKHNLSTLLRPIQLFLPLR